MKIAISGSGGFIGSELKGFLLNKGIELIEVKRDTILQSQGMLTEIIRDTCGFIHLSGSNLLRRWTLKAKKEIWESRIKTTQNIRFAIENSGNENYCFIVSSGVNVYLDNDTHTEESTRYNTGFLSTLVQEWERVSKVEKPGIRIINMRLGIVLGKSGGAYPIIRKSTILMGGTILGSGLQKMPFVHINDLKRAVLYFLENKESNGVYNLVAPISADNRTFVKYLSKFTNRFVLFKVPEFMLRFIIGEASRLVTHGPEVVPLNLMKEGFEFEFAELESAIKNLEGKE
jgi:uncharacterized protein